MFTLRVTHYQMHSGLVQVNEMFLDLARLVKEQEVCTKLPLLSFNAINCSLFMYELWALVV